MRSVFIVGLVTLFCFNLGAQTEAEVQLNQLYADIEFLSHDSLEGRETGTQGEIMAAEYIASRFDQLGLIKKGSSESTYHQVFVKKTQLHPHDTLWAGEKITGRNIIGFIDNGAVNTVVIGAHYDHLGWGGEGSGSLYTGDSMIHNGADDNASGVAALLFLAEKFSKREMSSNFMFIAFSGEEKGLLGSNYFVNNATMNLNDVNYMINMDMVGRLDVDRRLAIYGVGTSDVFIPMINEIESPKFEFALDSSGFGPSDHTSFYVNDIPVLHFFTGQHAQYHKPEDDIELINFEGLWDVSTFIEQLIVSLNGEEKLIFSKTRDTQNETRSFKVTLGIMPDYMYSEKGLKLDGVKENRPAFNAGLEKGDIIIQMGEYPIIDIYDYMDALKSSKEGDRIKVVYIRNNRTKKVNVMFD